MSAIEEACRWTIVQAWYCWAWWAHRPLGMIAYARAMGLEPTDPPRREETP